MAIVAAAALAVAVAGEPPARTEQDRIREIAESVACPQCDGQSVAESDVAISREIRREIARQVRSGRSDSEILRYLAERYGEDVLLEPPRGGVAGLVWLLPMLGLCAGGVLVFTALRRWSRLGDAGSVAGAEAPDGAGAGHALAPPSSIEREDSRVVEGEVDSSGGGGVGGRWRSVLLGAGTIALAVVVGVFLATNTRDRGASDTITGNSPGGVAGDLRRAEELVAAGDVKGAIAAYDRVLEADPQNVEALTYQASLFLREGRRREGISQLREALGLDPTFIDAWSFLVVGLSVQGDDRAIQKEIASLVDRGSSDVANAVAQQLLAGGRPVESLKVLDAILRVRPDDVTALAWRGWTLARATLYEDALRHLDKARELDPRDPEVLGFRAIVLAQMGRTEEARRELAAFYSTNPPPRMLGIVGASGVREKLEKGAKASDE